MTDPKPNERQIQNLAMIATRSAFSGHEQDCAEELIRRLGDDPVESITIRHEGDHARFFWTEGGYLFIISSFTNCGIWFDGIGKQRMIDFLIGEGHPQPQWRTDYFENALLHKRLDSRVCKREVKGLMKKMWPLFIEELRKRKLGASAG